MPQRTGMRRYDTDHNSVRQAAPAEGYMTISQMPFNTKFLECDRVQWCEMCPNCLICDACWQFLDMLVDLDLG